jgi:hypothetical protein
VAFGNKNDCCNTLNVQENIEQRQQQKKLGRKMMLFSLLPNLRKTDERKDKCDGRAIRQ